MNDERWLPIAGFEGLYSVSSHGRIRSEPRTVLYETGKRQTVRQRIMSPATKQSGHLSVILHGADKQRPRLHVHRLVLLAFVGPPPTPLHECAHNDGNPGNNHVENLRWATRSSNHRDKVAHGTDNRGEAHPRCTISDETVRKIRASTERPKAIAEALGVNFKSVCAIKAGTTRRWS